MVVAPLMQTPTVVSEGKEVRTAPVRLEVGSEDGREGDGKEAEQEEGLEGVDETFFYRVISLGLFQYTKSSKAVSRGPPVTRKGSRLRLLIPLPPPSCPLFFDAT